MPVPLVLFTLGFLRPLFIFYSSDSLALAPFAFAPSLALAVLAFAFAGGVRAFVGVCWAAVSETVVVGATLPTGTGWGPVV